MQSKWYRLNEEQDPLLSQHLISDSESDDSVSDHSRRYEIVSRHKLSGISTGRQRGVVTFERESSKSSSTVGTTDNEMQSSRLNRHPDTKTSHASSSATSLDELWRRFIGLQIIALEQAQMNKTDSSHRQVINSHRNQLDVRNKSSTIPSHNKQSATLTLTYKYDNKVAIERNVTPSHVAVSKEGNPVAFDISPGISHHSTRPSRSVSSLQPVTLQEALLHHKPMFASQVNKRQKLVREKRMRVVQNKQFVARETNKPVECWSFAERHYRPQQRHIDAKQAIQHTRK